MDTDYDLVIKKLVEIREGKNIDGTLEYSSDLFINDWQHNKEYNWEELLICLLDAVVLTEDILKDEIKRCRGSDEEPESYDAEEYSPFTDFEDSYYNFLGNLKLVRELKGQIEKCFKTYEEFKKNPSYKNFPDNSGKIALSGNESSVIAFLYLLITSDFLLVTDKNNQSKKREAFKGLDRAKERNFKNQFSTKKKFAEWAAKNFYLVDVDSENNEVKEKPLNARTIEAKLTEDILSKIHLSTLDDFNKMSLKQIALIDNAKQNKIKESYYNR